MVADFNLRRPEIQEHNDSDLVSTRNQILKDSLNDLRKHQGQQGETSTLLPRFEVVQPLRKTESPFEHQEMVHRFALELLSGRMTDDVKQYLSDSMNRGGPNALNLASREINEDMIRSTKGLPESRQLRLMYSSYRNRQNGEQIYNVTLQRHRDGFPLDGITFKKLGR